LRGVGSAGPAPHLLPAPPAAVARDFLIIHRILVSYRQADYLEIYRMHGENTVRPRASSTRPFTACARCLTRFGAPNSRAIEQGDATKASAIFRISPSFARNWNQFARRVENNRAFRNLK
jgi:hypothetical protein